MHANWAKGAVTAGGTGNLTLAAVSGFPTPWQALAGRPFSYVVLSAAGLPLESGIGYMSDATTLVRSRVTSSWDGTTLNQTSAAPVTVPAGAQVLCTPQAATLQAAAATIDAANTTGRFVLPANRTSPTGTLALIALRTYYLPFKLEFGAVVQGMACNVTTAAAAGGQAQLGMYSVSPAGGIGALIDSTAAFAVDSTGFKSQAFSGGGKLLPPGWYVAGLSVSAAVTITCHPTLQANIIGSNPFGMNGASLTAIDHRYEMPGSFGLPSSPGTGTVIVVGGGTSAPAVALWVQ